MYWIVLMIAAVLSARSTVPEDPQPKARVMIVGVYHFEAPNLDYVKSERVSHLSDQKQAEIAEVLARLAAFAPTKIVLEAPPDANRLLQRYAAYVKGEHELAENEREQLGFRLAKQLSHQAVHLADHPSDMDLNAVLTAARESGDRRFLEWFQGAMGEAQALMDEQARLSVRDALLMLNEPVLQDRSRDLYLQLARVRGKSGEFVGADVLAKWYWRNFCIFSNISGVIDSPSDRVLVLLFGQGHAPYLRELVRSSPDLELVEPDEYLRR